MAIKILKEVNRLPGNLPKTGETILEGEVLLLENDTVKKFDGTANALPLGFAIDSNVRFDSANSSGQTAGQGYDYTKYARQGLIGVALGAGSVLELFDDGKGHPVVTTDTFVQNEAVYTDASGKITSVSGTPQVGQVMNVSGSGSGLVLTIKTTI